MNPCNKKEGRYPTYAYMGHISLAMIITSLIKNDLLYMVYAGALTFVLFLCNREKNKVQRGRSYLDEKGV